MNISKKLLLSMVVLTSVVLVATLSLARWSFEQGFADFVNGLERERLGRLSEQVVQAYEDNNASWQNIDSSTIFDRRNNREKPPRRHQRPPPKGGPDKRPPPGPDARFNAGQRGDGRGPDRPKSTYPITFLYDVDGELLMSSENARQEFEHLSEHDREGIEINYPVYYQGQVIANLQSWNQAPSDSSLANQFELQQLKASFIIGGISLALAGALAFFIAQLFVKPIKQLSSGVTQLTQGNFDIALPNTGKDELGQLMRDTQALAHTLEKARSQKNRWFADISHELRTPLTILLGEIEAIKEGLRSFDEKQLVSIEQEVQMLNRLVEDLYQLSLSDLGALKYEFKDIDLSKMLHISVEAFTHQAKAKNIQISTSIESPVTYLADAQRFEQLINNLLKNALKYTDHDGKIHVSLSQTLTEVYMIVEDSHPGVPEHECAALFETLYQRNSARTRANSGAGLGLAICKNIAESHNANIYASASELGGLKVVVEMPKGRQ
ncbi:HAMP domain-containing protein [Glaciecola sp. MH2013]|uniref:ATP-binding protein n=1 Tax=Glaciecola sp. MH2013 TaxID=2785524 RepID=UPI0018A01D91|nr:ATP-binding protein [Glaciecola sp. MH2013]MBF7074258.1 HAMP domain-containing protein [Glaciecola sp. MH2013]